MPVIREISIEGWKKTAFILGLVIVAIMLSRYIASGAYPYLFFLLFSSVILFLFHKQLELFILLVLIINHEFFYLVPKPDLGAKDYQYQGLMYIVLFITGIWYFFRDKEENEVNFNNMIIFLMVIVVVGVFNSYFQGQPIILGLGAARSYFLILFYFVFMAKDINRQRLFRLIVIAGVLLMMLNNIQYIFFGKLNIFYFSEEWERIGQLRFLMGDFFTIFSPIIALGEYLTTKKKLYLIAFIYIAGAVIIQGQTRAVIWGFISTTLLMFYLAKYINFKKTVLIGIPLFAFSIWLVPVIKSTFLGELYYLTKYEVIERRGNVGVRLETYDYYFREIMQSPIIGRGIWSDAFRENNPEDMKYKGLHLGDIGITSLLFHLGMLGGIWLIVLFAKVYKLAFLRLGRLKQNIHYGLIGYFIFSIVTFPTLNSLTNPRTIIYLALGLALLSQLNYSNEKSQEA